MTLELGSGSCRAPPGAAMIAALRARGIAARFVSGYLHLAGDDQDCAEGGNTQPSVELYGPVRAGSTSIRREASWEIKISIRVAVAPDAREAIPLQGTWFGTAADHRAMKVAVKVTTADAGAWDCGDLGMSR